MDVPSVNHLPPELLIAIATFITDQSAIFRLATVCGYWYNVLTGTPTLWTSVDCRRGSRTAILLQRSRFHPIDVTIDRRLSPQAVSLVAHHTYRMRSIGVNLSSSCRFREVHSLLNQSAPILEKMSLGPTPLSSPHYGSFFRGRFPALKTLHLEGHRFDLARSASGMTNGLTTLVLDNTQHHRLHNLLEYLEHCKNLIHLRIDLPNLQGTIPTSHIVSLPNLRELRIVYPPLTLHHLSFPLSANLDIRSRARSLTGGDSLANAWTEDGLLEVFGSYTIKSVTMMFAGPNFTVRLLGPRLFLAEHTKVTTNRRTPFHSNCLDSLQSLPIATVEFLRFAQPPKFPFRWDLKPESCTRLLQQMPALQRIVLDISVVQFFIHALEPVNGQIPCPKLNDLIVILREGHEVGFREMVLRSSLFTLSNQRKDLGYPLVCATGSPGLLDCIRKTARAFSCFSCLSAHKSGK
jgi:hypothetical protein